jgi:ATP-dependent DNA helicase RecG
MSRLQDISVREIVGVGPQKVKELELLSIVSVLDLLEYFPYRYEDYRIRDVSTAQDGEKITIQGQIVGEPIMQMWGRKKSRLVCKVAVDRLFVSAVWFNRHFLKEHLTSGREIVLTGKWDARRRQLTVAESEFPGARSAKSGTLQPVYSISSGVTQAYLRKTMKQALHQFGERVEELLPESLMERHELLPRKKAIFAVHLPEEAEDGQEAHRRLVYEELFLFQLKLQAYRALSHKKADGIAQAVDLERVREFVRGLPFKLTASQKQVVREVLDDLQSPHPMNRLLQGDVGAGKTIVAAIGLFATWTAGLQGALMVPTEILAEQHAKSLERLLAPYGIAVGLLVGGLKDKRRREMLSALQMGIVHVVVGTHALIQEDVYVQRLGLVVVDEQHRFGVEQRGHLRRKGLNPDVLTMTATPIPRTLAISAFGDMDVSTLDELPKGRLPIKTYSVKHDMLSRVIGFIRREVDQGRQAYVICPLIEESEKLDVQNAVDMYNQLVYELRDDAVKVGLLHGRMPAAEKEEVMGLFAGNQLQVLVSTTVIEVGVDVPNATLMIINDADRFGLSQLHQLRGRVGRGEHQSYCVLIANPKSEAGVQRLRVMTETVDGFEISRHDLKLRGPGEFFGTRQSGVPEFKLADMLTDFDELEKARNDVARLLSESDFWTSASYTGLREFLQREQVWNSELLD